MARRCSCCTLSTDGVLDWLSDLVAETCATPPPWSSGTCSAGPGPDDLERMTAPTALIWGRHDRANRLRMAPIARARSGWPLPVIEDAVDDPARDQPAAFLAALQLALG